MFFSWLPNTHFLSLMWVSLPLLFSDMCAHTLRHSQKGENPLWMMKSILWRLLSCFPESFFLSLAWLIVSPCFRQQRIPQETTVIKKYWCWIHLFAFPKWSLAKFGCSRSSLYSSAWHRTHLSAVGLSQHFSWRWLHYSSICCPVNTSLSGRFDIMTGLTVHLSSIQMIKYNTDVCHRL